MVRWRLTSFRFGQFWSPILLELNLICFHWLLFTPLDARKSGNWDLHFTILGSTILVYIPNCQLRSKISSNKLIRQQQDWTYVMVCFFKVPTGKIPGFLEPIKWKSWVCPWCKKYPWGISSEHTTYLQHSTPSFYF